MDLDALAGVVAAKHVGEGVTTVTASVDRITLNHSMHAICDLELSGQVTFASGRSSVEVSLQVARASENRTSDDILMTCTFTMVSLDLTTKKPTVVNSLRIETPEEERVFKLGEQRSLHKKLQARQTLQQQPPNDEESKMIHAMWLQHKEGENRLALKGLTRGLPSESPNVASMASTVHRSSQIMQPQYRNRHHFMIFGGFLLKQTFELAFCCCAAFSHTRPVFVGLDPSTFEHPVPVGSVLYLTATVAFTDRVSAKILPADAVDARNLQQDSTLSRIQVLVDSRGRDIESGESKPTGRFNYTFVVADEVHVIPQTYSDFMIWIEARRRLFPDVRAISSAS